MAGVVKAGISAIALAAGMFFTVSAQADKPANWPSQYTWYEYSETAPQPSSSKVDPVVKTEPVAV